MQYSTPAATAAAVWLICTSPSSACSLNFTSPERGITVTAAQIGVSGTGSGNAKPSDVGQVTATINGRVFFQQSGVFTALIDFLGSGAASVILEPGENTLTVQGSVSGCSAGDSMTIHYVPPPPQEQKAAGMPADCNGTNPINGGNGNKYQEEVDYQGGGPHPLTFTRFYNSRYGERRMLGPRWRHTYDRQLAFSGGSHAYVIRPDGRAFHFVLTGSAWISDLDVNHRFSPLRDSQGVITGWRLDVGEDDSREFYDLKGRLTAIADRSGWTWDIAHDAAGRLSTITDRVSGRRLSFAYDSRGRLSELTDPAGRKYRYGYDASGRLSAVNYPDATGSPARLYHYEDSRIPNALTGITDESGVRYARFGYDGQGRANLSEHAGGNDRYSLGYNIDGSVTVTDPLGTARTYSYLSILGAPKASGQTQPAGAGCLASSSRIDYDANGNPSRRVGFNGEITQYAFDSARNLETARTEAAGTPQERTIDSQWHSDYRLPTHIEDFGRLITFSYDANGNLLRRSIMDKVTGKLRTWRYTYNERGQVTSADGPRTDVIDITRFTYYEDKAAEHRPGDLAVATDPLGHATTFAAYDEHGHPLRVVDANGRALRLTYDHRARLLQSDDDGEATNFRYDPIGQLVQVTEPDENFLVQTYDAAHRLTDLSDSLGNRAHFTLDAMGNRVREDVTDSLNRLTTTRSRIYDALNRLHQSIGAY